MLLKEVNLPYVDWPHYFQLPVRGEKRYGTHDYFVSLEFTNLRFMKKMDKKSGDWIPVLVRKVIETNGEIL